MKFRAASLAAGVGLGLGAGCIQIPSAPVYPAYPVGGTTASAGPGIDPRAAPESMSPVQTRSAQTMDRPQSMSPGQTRTPARAPEPMSPVQTLTPRTLDRPDQSTAEMLARLNTTTIAVQQALRIDHSPLSSNVQVGQQGGIIVLRGSVPDEATRIQVEQAARGATTGGFIDNQIRVEPR